MTKGLGMAEHFFFFLEKADEKKIRQYGQNMAKKLTKSQDLLLLVKLPLTHRAKHIKSKTKLISNLPLHKCFVKFYYWDGIF